MRNTTDRLRECVTKGGRGSKIPKILRMSFKYRPKWYGGENSLPTEVKRLPLIPVILRAPWDVHSMEGGPSVLGGRPDLRVSAPPSRRVPTSAPPICSHIGDPQGPTRVHAQRHSTTSNAPRELSNVSFLRPLQ